MGIAEGEWKYPMAQWGARKVVAERAIANLKWLERAAGMSHPWLVPAPPLAN